MEAATIHNPDRYMADLRQILSQGRKRIGILIGAGAPASIRVNNEKKIVADGEALIPDVAGLTDKVIGELEPADRKIISKLKNKLGRNPNIEAILSKVRMLSQAIDEEEVYDLDGRGYDALSQKICTQIGKIVGVCLPDGPNPYTELISWISGTNRDHAVEIFTPNYDLLIEEAFERRRIAYFDGFTGAAIPFFDAVSVSLPEELPPRWSRLWKLHGSLGWGIKDGTVVRVGNRNATELIYPDYLKYSEINRLPYSALFERLRNFLTTPDSLLITTGFSFSDSHICAVLDEALAANAHTAILAFQYKNLEDENLAKKLGIARHNLSVYAKDGAIISGILGRWEPGKPPNDEWIEIRNTFWKNKTKDGPSEFLLGDFAKLTCFFALAQAPRVPLDSSTVLEPKEHSPADADGISENTDVQS